MLPGTDAARSCLQFLCLKNIRTFLKVCHDRFGLRNSELFDPFDLFDVRDFGKVSRASPVRAGAEPGRHCAREGAGGQLDLTRS